MSCIIISSVYQSTLNILTANCLLIDRTYPKPRQQLRPVPQKSPKEDIQRRSFCLFGRQTSNNVKALKVKAYTPASTTTTFN